MKKFILPILTAFALTACEEMNFACDETSAVAAADFINENYEQYGGALELSDAQLVKSDEGHLYCRAQANIGSKFINYELIKKTNGDIYIMVNPLGDIIDEAFDETMKELDSIDFDMD